MFGKLIIPHIFLKFPAISELLIKETIELRNNSIFVVAQIFVISASESTLQLTNNSHLMILAQKQIFKLGAQNKLNFKFIEP